MRSPKPPVRRSRRSSRRSIATAWCRTTPTPPTAFGEAFQQQFGDGRVRETKPTTASEDFGSFGAEWKVPSVFWFVGGTDPQLYAKLESENKLGELPTNHNPRFAPVIHPTLETGVQTLVVASQAWLSA